MNLGDRVSCGKFTPTHIGLADRKVEEVIVTALEADTIALGGTDLQTTLTTLAGNSLTADWNYVSNKPSNLVDWTVDQGDTNIDANNLPLLNYAPNTLASNGTAGLTNYNFNQARKDKLAGIESGAQVNVQTDWNASGTSAAILNKPTWIPSSDPGYLTAVPTSVTNAIALNTAKVTYPGPPSWSEVTSKPALQEALTISNTSSSTFNGVTYLVGGLDLTSGTLTYIPPPLSVYAPLASPSFTGTVNLPSTTLIGSVTSTELGHLSGVTSSIQTQLDSRSYSAGSNLSLVGTTFHNTAPDQTVVLTQGGATTITGTYPNFTISSTDTTYTAGTGVAINGSNQIAIGQSVATTANPHFRVLSLGTSGVNQGVLNLKDFTNVGTDTVAQVKGILDGSNGGKLQFFTKVDGGSLTERFSISQTGFTKIQTDAVSLGLFSADGTSQQSYIYNSSTIADKDLVLDAQSTVTNKGITFRTGSGTDRMRITSSGNVGIGTMTPDAKLDVDGEIRIRNPDGNQTRFNYLDGGVNYIRGHLEVTNSSKISLMGGQNGGTDRGLYFYNSGDPNWGLYMATGGATSFSGSGTTQAGYGFGSYAVRLRVANSTVHGWIFEDSNENVMFSVRSNDGLGYFKGPVFSQTAYLTSDDRIKFNEKSLTDGLEVIRQLLPQEYMKSKEIDVEVDLEKEIGLIAQEVRQIPQLEHVVFQEPENPDGKLSVNYTQIFVYAIQAIKELDRKVAMLEARLAG